MADLVTFERPDHDAVAQHHDAVGAMLDFAQPVRDEDDADAAGLQVRDDGEEARGLRDREARCRLVHDDDAAVERQRLDDLEQLPLREREVGDRRLGGEIDADALQQRVDPPAQRLPVDQPQRASLEGLATEEDVGRDVEIVEKVELLMHEGDAGRHGVRDRQRLARHAVDRDRAARRRHHAAQDLHQGRLAGTVLADQPDDLAAAGRERYVAQRLRGAESLGDMGQRQKGLGHVVLPSIRARSKPRPDRGLPYFLP